MNSRQVAIEVFLPNEGLHTELTPSMITPRSTPFSSNAGSYYGAIQKNFGTTPFATGTSSSMGAPANGLYQAVYPGAATLQAFTHTGMYKYTSGSDDFVIDGQTYSGTFSDFWSCCMHNDVMVYANGVDLVQYKPSYSATGTTLGSVIAMSLKAYAVVSYKEHLNFYHTYESGNECYKRVRWTKAGTLAYATSDLSTGTANFVDVADMEGKLLTSLPLGPMVAIYAEGSIHVQEWVGGTEVYRITKMVANKGIPSRRAVVGNDTIHYVLTNDNVCEYYGGRELKNIGDAIQSRYMEIKNQSAMNTAFLEYNKDFNELKVHIPTGVSTYPDKCFTCKISENYAWYEGETKYTTSAEHVRGSALTIGELVGNIGAQNWKFGDKEINAGAVVRVLGDQTGQIVKRDKTVYSLSSGGTSAAQVFTFDTKDLSSIKDIDPLTRDRLHLTEYMDNETRWQGFSCELKGNGTIVAQYSIDSGVSWTNFPEGPKTLDTTWTLFEWDLDICSPQIRFRLYNDGINEVVFLRYFKTYFIINL